LGRDQPVSLVSLLVGPWHDHPIWSSHRCLGTGISRNRLSAALTLLLVRRRPWCILCVSGPDSSWDGQRSSRRSTWSLWNDQSLSGQPLHQTSMERRAWHGDHRSAHHEALNLGGVVSWSRSTVYANRRRSSPHDRHRTHRFTTDRPSQRPGDGSGCHWLPRSCPPGGRLAMWSEPFRPARRSHFHRHR
jgi:hypothetical protein